MTTVCIHQPDYLPWAGFFHRLLLSDIFVIFDDVQYITGGWQNRDKIKTHHGAEWLTVPILHKGRHGQLINEVLINKKTSWRRKHSRSIEANYRQAPAFSLYGPPIREVFEREWVRLVDLNMTFIRLFMEFFDIEIEFVFSSTLKSHEGRNERLVAIVKEVGGSTYLSGQGAREYLDEAQFADVGIAVRWQEFGHPVYPQLHGSFVPGLSSLDLLLNCGETSAALLRGGAGGEALAAERASSEETEG